MAKQEENQAVEVIKEQYESRSGTYSVPKTWGQLASQGDIFVATRHDAQYSGGQIVEGDFYIAQNDGWLSGFPYWGQNNADWHHAWTGVRDFSVTLDAGTSASIYANGRNQIGVRAHFTPTDSFGRVVPLSPAVLERVDVFLLDYNSNGTDLPYGWGASTTPGEFNRPVLTADEAESVAGTAFYGSKERRFYLSSTNPARAAIGCGIRLPGGTQALIRYDSSTQGALEVAALPPITYDGNNTRLAREDTADGSDWDQDNYYFTIIESGHYIYHADINAQGWQGPNYWSIISKSEHPRWHFVWDFGPSNSAYFSPLGINISYNQRPDAVCLTRLLSTSYDSGYHNGYAQVRITIYDQYGNSGLFSAVRNDSDWGNTLFVRPGNQNSGG